MRILLAAASAIAVFTGTAAVRGRATPAIEQILANDNRDAAGTLDKGVLTVHLEAREGEWRPDGEARKGIVVRAFGERGKPLTAPGPMIRVPEGTEIRASVTNSLPRTLVVRGLATRSAVGSDTLQVAAGATREVRFTAGAPGTYYYQGLASDTTDPGPTVDAELNGAFIVDPRGAPQPARDRVLLISLWSRVALPGAQILGPTPLRFTINGRSWPYTERLAYDVGDTIRFRVINTSAAVHPMHLHGFYFDVNSRGNASVDSVYSATAAPHRVVTERMAGGRTFSMTWVPERPGNWLFHCHDNRHVLRNFPLDGSSHPAEHLAPVKNHANDMMGGLVMAVEVRGRQPSKFILDASVRRLRLVAQVEAGGTDSEPSFGYVLQEGSRSSATTSPLLPGPVILLKRGQPVAITVANRLPEPTAVHWHGMELDSYFDGVADFSGAGRNIARAIAPKDSFVARFTPPRSGTFMYHPHADELRQQQAGLTGALLVVDDPAAFDPTHDIVVLLTTPRLNRDGVGGVYINGSLTPAPLELKAGERYRLRLVDVHTFRPSMIARVLRDSTPVTWRALAKDGMDLPPERMLVRPAVQQMGNGETYDFELAPTQPGDLRLTVTAGNNALLGTLPIKVR